MRIIIKLIVIGLVLLGDGLLADIALADKNNDLPPPAPDEIAEFGTPVSDNFLSSLSGGQNMQIDNIDMLLNNMNVKSSLADNILYSTTTGANIISDDAFSSASGISTVIQNSGNQVIINSAMILNLRVQ